MLTTLATFLLAADKSLHAATLYALYWFISASNNRKVSTTLRADVYLGCYDGNGKTFSRRYSVDGKNVSRAIKSFLKTTKNW